MQLLEASYYSEEYGVTLHPEKLATETQRYAEAAVSQQQRAIAIAARNSQNKEINLNSGPQLQRLLFTDFKLPVLKKTETGQPSTDAEVLEKLSAAEATSPSAREFLTSLLSAKRNQKAADALTSYKDWAHESTEEVRRPGNGSSVSASFRPGDCLRVSVGDQRDLSRHRDRDRQRVVSPRRDQSGQLSTSHGRGGDLQRLSLHPHINITGTSFTRQSFSSPNLQNVGTGKEEEGADGEKVLEYQLRVCFGPQPGRLWLDVDYSNIELRIWAYSCGNKEFIRCFEQDYSVHLLIAQELHPELKRMSDDDAKETKSYKKTKNGNFAIIYGSSPFQADRTYGVSGAYDKISARFPEVRSFTQKLHRLVEAQGYIETLCGYRLYIPLDEPHKAVSGFVQGSAGDIIGFAMSDAHQWLCRRPELDIHLPLQVHDQLVFDCPANTNRQHLRSLLGLMESQGKRIGIPLPVSAKLCQTNWTEGTKFV
jgi:DNA polymerase I-like protein with 3'-5' exonuclease and polymerase domains